MIRIMGWEIRRILPDRKCCSCERYEWGPIPVALHDYRGKDVCQQCWGKPGVLDQLDAEYWRTRPDSVPPCQHCGKTVAPDLLRRQVCVDWYFCPECAADPQVIRRFEAIADQKFS